MLSLGSLAFKSLLRSWSV